MKDKKIRLPVLVLLSLSHVVVLYSPFHNSSAQSCHAGSMLEVPKNYERDFSYNIRLINVIHSINYRIFHMG